MQIFPCGASVDRTTDTLNDVVRMEHIVSHNLIPVPAIELSVDQGKKLNNMVRHNPGVTASQVALVFKFRIVGSIISSKHISAELNNMDKCNGELKKAKERMVISTGGPSHRDSWTDLLSLPIQQLVRKDLFGDSIHRESASTKIN